MSIPPETAAPLPCDIPRQMYSLVTAVFHSTAAEAIPDTDKLSKPATRNFLIPLVVFLKII